MVKNRAPASIQITAEQLIREASERQDLTTNTAGVVLNKVNDADEYQSQLRMRRKTFEDEIRRQRCVMLSGGGAVRCQRERERGDEMWHYCLFYCASQKNSRDWLANSNPINRRARAIYFYPRRREHIGTWVKYAKFEEENKEFERARSLYERALEVDHKGPQLWLKYAEFEMRNEFINHARNVWDRAVAILPRVDQLWYKYTYMEEMVGDVPKARAVWERWMEWQPDDNAWLSFARFEKRCGDLR